MVRSLAGEIVDWLKYCEGLQKDPVSPSNLSTGNCHFAQRIFLIVILDSIDLFPMGSLSGVLFLCGDNGQWDNVFRGSSLHGDTGHC